MGTKNTYYFDPQRIELSDGELFPEEMEIKRHFLAPDPRDEIISRLDLEEALKTLTPYQREVWTSFSEGCSLVEIAEKHKRHFTSIRETLLAAAKKIRNFILLPTPKNTPKVDVPIRGILG